MTTRLSVWSGPRNISTALMYSFAQRADTTVVDEPLYGHYLAHSDAHRYHPGAAEVMASMSTDATRVIDDVILGEYSTPVLFLKNMTHHLVGLDWDFVRGLSNVILTRSPLEMLPSYAQQVADPTLTDTGYDTLVRLVDYLEASGLPAPMVLDSSDILRGPRSMLTQLCRHADIDFDSAMLSWEAGPRPEDGVWAKHWYESVHHSSGFAPYRPKPAPFPDRLRPLLEQCQPLYNRLRSLANHP